MDFGDILAKKKPATKSVSVLLNTDLANQIDQLREELRTEQRKSRFAPSIADGSTNSLQEQIEKLQEQARDESVTFTFTSIGRKTMQELAVKHPPTKELKEQGAAWNPDTFGPELIHLSCIDPTITLEQAAEMWNSPAWNEGEILSILTAAIEVNTEKPDIPFSVRNSDETTSSD